MKETVKPWMEFAEKDLLAAEKLQSDEAFSNIVMFHCQQCVEKSMKALFEENNRHVPRIHSTSKLFSDLLALDSNITPFVSIEDLTYIDAVYVDSRYPGGFGLLPNGHPTRQDVARGIEIAGNVFTNVSALLSRKPAK